MNNNDEKNMYLKSFRISESLNQDEMAKIIGMSRATYVSKENGRVDFTLREIKTIASKFELEIVKINEIFFNDLMI